MASFLNPPLQPRDGKVLRVLGIARVSKTKKNGIDDNVAASDDQQAEVRDGRRSQSKDRDPKKELSLVDQEALIQEWLQRHYGEPYKLDGIKSTGSG